MDVHCVKVIVMSTYCYCLNFHLSLPAWWKKSHVIMLMQLRTFYAIISIWNISKFTLDSREAVNYCYQSLNPHYHFHLRVIYSSYTSWSRLWYFMNTVSAHDELIHAILLSTIPHVTQGQIQDFWKGGGVTWGSNLLGGDVLPACEAWWN